MTSRRPPPVAIFHPGFGGVGGAEVLVATQAQYLRRAGIDVRVATFAYRENLWRREFDGVPIRVAGSPPWFSRLSSKLTQLERSVPLAEELFTDCRAVLAANPPCNALLGASSYRGLRAWWSNEPSRELHLVATFPTLDARVRSVPSGRSDAERDYRRKLAKQRLRGWSPRHRALVKYDLDKSRELDVVITVSEFERNIVGRLYERNDVQVINSMIRFPPEFAARRAGLDRSGLRVLTHTRLETPKNVELVLHAFRLFSAQAPGSLLHVVGEGTQRGRLETLARRLGISSAVHFHGYLPDAELKSVYEACEVFALAPIDEPFGMVFPEAAARGLLLVGPNHGGPLEILDGGRLGWVCDPFDPATMAEAFQRIWATSDAEIDAMRTLTESACRGRYSEAVLGPALERALIS